jgi:hypothetical protein
MATTVAMRRTSTMTSSRHCHCVFGIAIVFVVVVVDQVVVVD